MIRFLFGLVLLLCLSCSNDGNGKTVDLLNDKKNDNDTYPYEMLGSISMFEESLDFLKDTKWKLKKKEIYPSSKTSFDLSTEDTSFFHRVNSDNIYQFLLNSNLIIRNNQKIGKIELLKNVIDSIKIKTSDSLVYNKITYNTIFDFDYSTDTVLRGAFEVIHLNMTRLHLEHYRIDNRTKDKETVRLIFYKIKEKLHSTQK